ncbi:CDP-glucose 4,6-dehydratase [Jannaschia sp. KMU-145]|uniref:CDP-glucose 4,6-dehydratase n=1 Tax=Jannaschia halovivens TaxID=3388667 RepID=UPI00396AF84C
MEDLGVTTFWQDRRVLVTGHTGFKGAWLAFWLSRRGARVTGLALPPDGAPNLFDQLGMADLVDHRICDIRDAGALAAHVDDARPEIVFHLAAQSLVLDGYDDPLRTWQTNVMGTAHLLEALRGLDDRCAAVMVTTDKVYENPEDGRAFLEGDPLGGHDPYSASKAAMEIAVASWRRAFPGEGGLRIASARAGNVVGGGDWARNRIVPDIARALAAGRPVEVRNAAAVRPWQHVLEPLAGYLALAETLWTTDAPEIASAFNFGPDPAEIRPVRDVVTEALRHWPGDWAETPDPDAPHEAGFLSLDPSKARRLLGVAPRWDFAETIARTVGWYRAVHEGADPATETRAQISAFEAA